MDSFSKIWLLNYAASLTTAPFLLHFSKESQVCCCGLFPIVAESSTFGRSEPVASAGALFAEPCWSS